MIRLLQLLIVPFFLNDSFAQKCQSDKDCITTYQLIEKSCTLLLLSHEPIDPKNRNKHKKAFQYIVHGEFKSPQCYISSKDNSGKSLSGGRLMVTCYCLEKFSAACMSSAKMAESLYQWRRDSESKDSDGIDDSEYLDKVDCILKGFEKIQGNYAKQRPTELQWGVECDPLVIDKYPSMSSKNIEPLAKNTRLAIDLDCYSSLLPRVYCSEDYCHEEVEVIKNQLIPLKVYNLLYKSLNKGQLVPKCDMRNPSNPKGETQCILSAFRQLIDNFFFTNGTKTETPTIRQIGATRQKYKVNQNLDMTTSNHHIFAWFFMVLYIGPFVFTCFVSMCNCNHELRNELGIITNPTLKDIEDTLVNEIRKNEELNVSVKKEVKPKSEIIDLAVTTTTSQMGNITDLASEGPTGPSGGSEAKTGPQGRSNKSLKKDSTALKSVEDTKEAIGDSAL